MPISFLIITFFDEKYCINNCFLFKMIVKNWLKLQSVNVKIEEYVQIFVGS